MKALLLLPLLLASCTFMDKDTLLAFGGRGAYNGRDFSGTWDNVENMNNALLAATVIGGGAISAGVEKSKHGVEKTQIKSTETTTLGAQGVQKFEIGEETKRIIHSTPNPNIIPK